MKTSSHKMIGVALVVLIVFLSIAGCQSAAQEQAVTPTVAPVEVVVAEREGVCPLLIVGETDPLSTMNDPELGEMQLAYTVSAKFNCSESYLKGKLIGILDGYTGGDGSDYFGGFHEFVTDEGGIWRGTCDSLNGTSQCTLTGDGLYKGMQMTSEYVFDDLHYKLRVVKLGD